MNETERLIIREMAKCNMNISEVSRNLSYHRNSIVYHIEKIIEKTNLDCRKFYDLMKLLDMNKKDIE